VKNYTDLVTSAAPTAAARVRLRPVDARGVAIRDGLLADRQRVNREVTLLRGAEELERAGTLDNLRICGGTGLGRAARHGLQRLGRLQVARGARVGARPPRNPTDI
jgi:hypothetical protein